MQGQILMPLGISAGLSHEARHYPAGITTSKFSPPVTWPQPACCGAFRAGPRTSAAQAKLSAGFPRLKMWVPDTSQAVGEVGSLGCCAHTALPWQWEHPALRGLVRRVAGLRLGIMIRQPQQYGLPVTSATFCCTSFNVNSVVFADYQLNSFPLHAPFQVCHSKRRSKASLQNTTTNYIDYSIFLIFCLLFRDKEKLTFQLQQFCTFPPEKLQPKYCSQLYSKHDD